MCSPRATHSSDLWFVLFKRQISFKQTCNTFKLLLLEAISLCSSASASLTAFTKSWLMASDYQLESSQLWGCGLSHTLALTRVWTVIIKTEVDVEIGEGWGSTVQGVVISSPLRNIWERVLRGVRLSCLDDPKTAVDCVKGAIHLVLGITWTSNCWHWGDPIWGKQENRV